VSVENPDVSVTVHGATQAQYDALPHTEHGTGYGAVWKVVTLGELRLVVYKPGSIEAAARNREVYYTDFDERKGASCQTAT